MQLSDPEKKALFGLLVNSLPAEARGSVYSDRAICAKFGVTPEFWFPLDPATGVETTSLNDALRAAIAGRKSALLKLRDGRRVRAKLGKLKGGQATLQLNKKSFAFSNADLLSTAKKARGSALRRAFEARPPSVEEEKRWHDFAVAAAFGDF